MASNAQSAAYEVAIVAVVSGLIGALIITATDPVAQAVFASSLYNSCGTTYCSNTLGWMQDGWMYWPAFILFGILSYVWIKTRRVQ